MLKEILKAIWLSFPWLVMVARLVVVPVTYIIHELAHGITALALGDPTPRERDRITVNPKPQMEWFGLISGVLVGVGWSRRTPFDPYRMRVPPSAGGVLVALSGPLVNLGLALGGATLVDRWFGGQVFIGNGPLTIAGLASVFVRFNLTVGLLNLVPLFPLDGWEVVRSLLPQRTASWWERASGWTTTALGLWMAFLLLMPVWLLVRWLGPPARWILGVTLGW